MKIQIVCSHRRYATIPFAIVCVLCILQLLLLKAAKMEEEMEMNLAMAKTMTATSFVNEDDECANKLIYVHCIDMNAT